MDHITGVFVKGYAGLGGLSGGKLQDEDWFPPEAQLGGYSSTDSEQRGGSLAYGTVDLGWAYRTHDITVGFFAGYHLYSEQAKAYGCKQTAGNPFICNSPPAIPTSTLVITQDTKWHAVRLGFNSVWRFAPGWKLTSDVALLPFVFLDAKDTHHLRPELSSGLRETGGSFGNVQAEAVVTYDITSAFSVGVGARYWRIQTQKGDASVHFNETAVATPAPSAATLITDRWGAFVQASYKFGGFNTGP